MEIKQDFKLLLIHVIVLMSHSHAVSIAIDNSTETSFMFVAKNVSIKNSSYHIQAKFTIIESFYECLSYISRFFGGETQCHGSIWRQRALASGIFHPGFCLFDVSQAFDIKARRSNTSRSCCGYDYRYDSVNAHIHFTVRNHVLWAWSCGMARPWRNEDERCEIWDVGWGAMGT